MSLASWLGCAELPEPKRDPGLLPDWLPTVSACLGSSGCSLGRQGLGCSASTVAVGLRRLGRGRAHPALCWESREGL